MKVKYVRSEQRIYALDDNGNVINNWECRSAFVPGYNEAGQPRESLPDGVYSHVSAELESYGDSYGTFYIETGDQRERDIHGGGSSLADPYAPRQGWARTLGCLRMQNEDGEALAQMIIDAGNDVELIVGD